MGPRVTTAVSSPSGHSRNGHFSTENSSCFDLPRNRVDERPRDCRPIKICAMIVDQDGLAVIRQNISLGHDFAEPSPLTKAFNLVELFRTKAQGKRRSRCCRQFADECRRDFGWKASATSLLPPRLMPVRCAVQAVNIRPIMNRAVGARPGIEIDPSNRNGPAEVDPLLVALPRRIGNHVTIPVVVRVAV